MTSQIEKEFEEFESQQIWPQVYQKVRNEASLKSISEKHSVGEARKPENRSKNRYRDVSPYDHSRVILQKGDSDYINASLIKVPESKRQYILSQGPLEHTAGQFWQMIWEQNTKAVVMLNRVIEKGTLKCHQYWPLGEDDEEDVMDFDETGLKVTLMEDQETQHFTVRTFELENTETNETRDVYHFHYTTWPDFGIPSSPVSFLEFLDAVREKGVLEENVGPAVIHCSAGIGRSGTFCLVDSALVLIERSGTMEGINLQSLLISMRNYRMGLIQTFDQLKFSYMAIIAGGRKFMATAGAQQVNSVLDGYTEHKDSGDEAPDPPQRVESLSPNKRGKIPPPPPPRSFPVDDTSSGEPNAKLPKLDDNDIPQKPPRAHVFETNNDYYSTVSNNDLRDGEEDTIETMASRKSDRFNDSASNDRIGSKPVSHTENNNPTSDESANVVNKDVTGKSGENQIERNDGGPDVGDAQEGNYEEIPPDGSHEQQHNSVSEDTRDTQLRQRRKEDREKRREKTQEVIRQMKEKQQKSETWKKRKSYFKPVVIGLSLLLGSFLIYKFYW